MWQLRCIMLQTISTVLLITWPCLLIKIKQFPQKKMFFRHFSWALNQHIRIIFDGSCDTEGWSNGCEHSACFKSQLFINLIGWALYDSCALFQTSSASSWPTCPTTGMIVLVCTPSRTWWSSYRCGPIWNCRLSRLYSWRKNISKSSLRRGTPSGR